MTDLPRPVAAAEAAPAASYATLHREMCSYAAGARAPLALLVSSQLVKLAVPWLAAQAIDALQRGGATVLGASLPWLGTILAAFAFSWALHGPGRVLERKVAIRVGGTARCCCSTSPTSALDPLTEAMVFRRIDATFPRACIGAAVHRMSLIAHFDRVVLMSPARASTWAASTSCSRASRSSGRWSGRAMTRPQRRPPASSPASSDSTTPVRGAFDRAGAQHCAG